MKKHVDRPLPRRNILMHPFVALPLMILYIIAILSLICFLIYPALQNQERKNRINAIYASFKLADTYIVQRESIFGEKKPYEWDTSRTQASLREYTRATSIETAVTEVKKAIEDAGFTYFDEPYPGSTRVQYHFKSKRNEYVRLTVSDKQRTDGVVKSVAKQEANVAKQADTKQSQIIIRVNLDDNNE